MSQEPNIYGYREVLKEIIEIHSTVNHSLEDRDLDLRLNQFFDKYALTLVQALGGPYYCDLCGQQYYEYKMCCEARKDYLSGFREPPLEFPPELNPHIQLPLIIRRIRFELDEEDEARRAKGQDRGAEA